MSDPYAAADLENGKYPPAYYVQCVHYLAVTGYDRWYLAIMVLGRGFYIFTIERDQAEIDALMAGVQRFLHSAVEETEAHHLRHEEIHTGASRN